ncbi:MAG: hypothetical protein WA159_19490 [Variovorax sp.]
MQRMSRALCGALVLSVLLAACGGGGGDSGSATPSSGTGSASASAETQLTVKVSVNGAQATPDASGTYAVKPGDTVVVTPSQTSSWTSTNGTAGAITLRNPSISGSQWASQLVNTLATTTLYTVTASVGSTLSATAVFSVAAADARNGEYMLYGASGTRLALTLNFDTSTYAMEDTTGAGNTASGDFSAVAGESGSYVFATDRIASATNTARFRVTDDTIVGAFPFVNSQQASSTVYSVRPFVASRALATDQASLDGIYNRFLVTTATDGSTNSSISQMQISAGGTLMTFCANNAIYLIGSCPTGSQVRYSISAGSRPGLWVRQNLTNPSEPTGGLAVARIGGQNVYLSAGRSPGSTTTSGFQIGLPETGNWPAIVARGGSTQGTWGTSTVDGTNYSRAVLWPDSTANVRTATIDAPGAPLGIRVAHTPATEPFFLMQSSKLFAMIGARDVPATAGYLQLGLID